MIRFVKTLEEGTIEKIKQVTKLEIEKIITSKIENDHSLEMTKAEYKQFLKYNRWQYNECDSALKKGSGVLIYDTARVTRGWELDYPHVGWKRPLNSASFGDLFDSIGQAAYQYKFSEFKAAEKMNIFPVSLIGYNTSA